MSRKDRGTDGVLPPKARKLIEAIVDAAIARGEGGGIDRDVLLAEAMEEFRQVSHLQAEAAKLIRRQRRLLADQAGRIIALEEQVRQLTAVTERRDRRLHNARETILNFDGEIERLTAQTRADADLIEELREALRGRGGRRSAHSRTGRSAAGNPGRADQADGAAPPGPGGRPRGRKAPSSGSHPMSSVAGGP